MPMWLQNLLAILIVAAAAAVILADGLRRLLGKRSQLGNCCSRQCPLREDDRAGRRVGFVPLESLFRKR